MTTICSADRLVAASARPENPGVARFPLMEFPAETSPSEPSDGAGGLDSAAYFELRKLAAHWMRQQPAHHTLQVTALVHEAYLKLWAGRDPTWADRGHLLAAASQAMRHVLVDHARANRAKKRSGGRKRSSLDDLVLSYEAHTHDLVALDDSLAELAAFDPEMARAVDLRVFGGLEPDEIARILGLSRRTFDRRWAAIRVWLRSRME